MRQLDIQWEIHDYPARHPHSAIVNMGCGLDRTGQSCDNGTCRIYNVDMPNIIEARKLLSPAGERELNISSDLNDYSWMDKIDGVGGAIFFAAGVFHYLTFNQAKALATELARRFPGGRLVFDTVGKLGKLLIRRTFKNFGIEDYGNCLCVEDIAKIAAWVPSASVSERGYMLGYYDMDDSGVMVFARISMPSCSRRLLKLGMPLNMLSTTNARRFLPFTKTWRPLWSAAA